MTHNKRRQEHDSPFNLILDTFLFPIFRISKVLFSSEPLKPAFKKDKWHIIVDICALILIGVVLYYLGRIVVFGHQATLFWGIGGVIACILLISYLIGYLRRKYKYYKLNGNSLKKRINAESELPTNKAVLLTEEQWQKIIQDNPNILKDNPQLKIVRR